ncbi:hypothetical protein Vafri_16521 [Volvox africanus]|uniref:AMP-binding enzyme C-terminal domain-containing protein n=2 Tax=Volvox africanus TaxID=51714 RepID=A0A8J4BJ57_9CHLO|nr:hypothetical protein Vafri_16521 [Volvox africanus]GIL62332.1 hypothetical protein Vafri_16521 [Volvox africanus]
MENFVAPLVKGPVNCPSNKATIAATSKRTPFHPFISMMYAPTIQSFTLLTPPHQPIHAFDLISFSDSVGFQVPKRWQWVKALPRNVMGKVHKKELLKMLQAGQLA